MQNASTVRLQESPEPRTGQALGATLASVLLFAGAVRFPLLLPLAIAAPFPLMVVRIRSGLGGATLSTLLAGALLSALFSPGQGLRFLLFLVVPGLVMTEALARGRGLVRGCLWAFGVLATEAMVGLLFANPFLEAVALGPFQHSRSPEFLAEMRASGMGPEQIQAWVDQATMMFNIMQVVYPAAYIIGCALVVLANATLLRFYLRRRDPGWLDGGEFEGIRMPLALAVLFVAAGLGVLAPALRPAAYNVLLVLAFFFALQGLAVAAYYAHRLAAPPILRGAVLLLVLINPWAPQILGLIGLFDIWFDFRKWAEPPERG